MKVIRKLNIKYDEVGEYKVKLKEGISKRLLEME